MNVQVSDFQSPLSERISGLDWPVLTDSLLDSGFATTGPLLTPGESRQFRRQYDAVDLYRSHIRMARYNFGEGEYKYFAYPLPDTLQSLRTAFYSPLAGAANVWADRLGKDCLFPGDHRAFIDDCNMAGQSRPTPLILKYRAGDYNCLHQDLYGDLYFPFQVAVLLSEPGADFGGGEFILVENRPRMQSKVSVVPLRQGEAVIFAVNQRPRLGSRGYHRAVLRHGVSEINHGERYTLGLIFHDAK